MAKTIKLPALTLIHICLVYAEVQGRGLRIDNDPAPPPDQGPPLSRNASRDTSLLPRQICGIVGAYVFTVAVLGLCLVTFGKRMRRAAQLIQSTGQVEMTKPWGKRKHASPASPASSQRTWPIWGSPDGLRENFRKSNAGSPVTIASFDQNVLESDKIQRQLEMERLYAAVMQQEDGKMSHISVAETREAIELESTSSSRQPLRLDTGTPTLSASESPLYRLDPASPSSPISSRTPVKAIYPPWSSMRHGSDAATSPIRASYNEKPYMLQDEHPLQPPNADPVTSLQAFPYQTSRRELLDEAVPNSSTTFPLNFSSTSNRYLSPPVITLDSSSSTLPLRAMAPNSPSLNNIQTTIIEPRRDLLSASNLRTGLATPYSPYMPFTPITPVAPRLVGRQERRIREREEGRRVVFYDEGGDWGRSKGDEELWGGGY